MALFMRSTCLLRLWGEAPAPWQVTALPVWPTWAAAVAGVPIHEVIACVYQLHTLERHSLHHQRGAHRNNGADLPLSDMLFGPCDNPRRRADEIGFWPSAWLRITGMLITRSVSHRP
jgi:hypothetical protein